MSASDQHLPSAPVRLLLLFAGLSRLGARAYFFGRRPAVPGDHHDPLHAQFLQLIHDLLAALAHRVSHGDRAQVIVSHPDQERRVALRFIDESEIALARRVEVVLRLML